MSRRPPVHPGSLPSCHWTTLTASLTLPRSTVHILLAAQYLVNPRIQRPTLPGSVLTQLPPYSREPLCSPITFQGLLSLGVPFTPRMLYWHCVVLDAKEGSVPSQPILISVLEPGSKTAFAIHPPLNNLAISMKCPHSFLQAE